VAVRPGGSSVMIDDLVISLMSAIVSLRLSSAGGHHRGNRR
jgi:hypothetical protein